MIGASKGLGLHAIKYPSGRWGFVGSVPLALAYTGPAEDIEKARQFGPGMYPNVKGRSWATREEAVAEANALGFDVAKDGAL